MNINQINKAADNLRILEAAMVEKAKSGHPGGAMGGADFTNLLYAKYLVYDPENPHWFMRDRFFLDPGHMSTMLYGALYFCGKYTIEDLQAFRQWGSVTPGHPEVDIERGIENASGPLGQGHVMAVGAAIAERFFVARFGEVVSHKTFAFISDGGIQEEISQGAGRLAGYLGLNNLIMFYDSNKVQLASMVDATSTEDTAAKYKAWNWNVIEIDGCNPVEIADALENALAEEKRPTIIIGDTVMGKGCVTENGENFEFKCSTHGNPLSKSGASYEKTISNLGGDPENPWVLFPETKELYEARKDELKAIVAERKAKFEQWASENPEKAQELQNYIDGKMPEIDYKAIAHKPNIATRTASADVLAELGDKLGNMIVSSADLANSDKTEGFIKKKGHLFGPRDFSGTFLQAGVAELTMASIMNGIALHGGLQCACGTFFVFSDYMKPAFRMAALMELPVKYVWSHDSFRVGEDGPTHEPVEQETQLRLMEELKNHSGKNSILVLRPADSAETTIAWKMAMENKDTPTALILTRQNINDIAPKGTDRYEEAKEMEKGGYIVMECDAPDVVLVGNGSDVSLLIGAAKELDGKGVKSRVVSMPSIGLWRNQSAEYKESVIPSGVPVFGKTSGLPSTFATVVGANGMVSGLDHFGESAPAGVLEEKFGFTVEHTVSEILNFLSK